jgi:GAF domain-containing protein
VLQVVRVVGALVVVAIAAALHRLDPVLVLGAAVYALLVGIGELLRRRFPERSGTFVTTSVVLDGVALALLVWETGGFRSPFLFLVFLDVVAFTMLASYWTGVHLAVWCALLLLIAHAAADSGFIDSDAHVSDRFAVVTASTFLLFALSAAAFSSVNERALRHSRGQLASLVELGAQLERARRAEDVMVELVRHACGRLGFVRVAVLARRGDRWAGIVDDGKVEASIELPDRHAPIVWETWSGNEPVLVRTLDDPLLDAVLPDASNVLVVPVAVDNERLGVVVAEWGGDDSARIPTLTVQGLAQAAMHTALALRNAELLVEVERLATRDELTGIANRRLFDESLARETVRSQRLGVPLSLVVFDVDHFKQINDTFGHLAGDDVLRDVASALVSGTKGFLRRAVAE